MSIKVDKLSKHYAGQKAVDEISFEVASGEILGFLGPNGAGKTTTMKMLTCYMAPTSGDAVLNGMSIHQDQNAIKKKIGYLPEHNPLYLDMAIVDYLRFSAQMQGVASKNIMSRVKEMISVCGLNKEKHKNIGELSKGYRQRVGLAQAMIHDPEILILDEPTTGLDPNQIGEIRTLIRDLGKRKTVIFSTHILPEVEATCDRVMIINGGKKVADGTPTSIREQASGGETLHITIEDAQDYQQTFSQLKAIPTIAKVEATAMPSGKFVVQSKLQESSKREIFHFCKENNLVLTQMQEIETSLEDIFKNLTVN